MTNKQDKVFFSIITPTYNSLEFFDTSRSSLLLQEFTSYEHIVIDNNSSDGIEVYLDSCKDNRTFFLSEKDDGIYDALNKGIRNSNGKVIGILHSDDFYNNSEVLRRVYEAFQDNEIKLVYSDLNYVSKNNKKRIIRFWKSGAYAPWKLKFGWMPPHPTVFVRRDILISNGLYSLDFKIASDYDFLLRLLNSLEPEQCRYISKVLVNMQTGGESNKNLKNIFLKMREDYLIAKKNSMNGVIVVFFKNFIKISQLFRKKNEPS